MRVLILKRILRPEVGLTGKLPLDSSAPGSFQITLFDRNLLPNPKPVCLMLRQAKAQGIRVWSEKRFINGEGADQEAWRPLGASDPPSLLDRAQGFEGLGQQAY